MSKLTKDVIIGTLAGIILLAVALGTHDILASLYVAGQEDANQWWIDQRSTMFDVSEEIKVNQNYWEI